MEYLFKQKINYLHKTNFDDRNDKKIQKQTVRYRAQGDKG